MNPTYEQELKRNLKFKRVFNGGLIANLFGISRIRSESDTLDIIIRSGLGNSTESAKKVLEEFAEKVQPYYSPFNENGLSLGRINKKDGLYYRLKVEDGYFSPL